MINVDEIKEILIAEKMPFTGTIIQGDTSSNHFFVFIAVTRDSDNKQVPSNKRIQQLKEKLLVEGAVIDFLLQDSQSNDIEVGLRATLLHAFGDSVRNSFLSISGNEAKIWIEAKRVLDQTIFSSIKKQADQYLSAFGIQNTVIWSNSETNLPTLLVCLRAIRLHSPINVEDLKKELINAKYDIPSIAWLNKKLDLLRKDGKIIRKENKSFAITYLGLSVFAAEKGRSSQDIKRILALSKRQ